MRLPIFCTPPTSSKAWLFLSRISCIAPSVWSPISSRLSLISAPILRWFTRSLARSFSVCPDMSSGPFDFFFLLLPPAMVATEWFLKRRVWWAGD